MNPDLAKNLNPDPDPSCFLTSAEDRWSAERYAEVEKNTVYTKQKILGFFQDPGFFTDPDLDSFFFKFNLLK